MATGNLDIMYWIERVMLLGTAYDLVTASVDVSAETLADGAINLTVSSSAGSPSDQAADKTGEEQDQGSRGAVVYCALRELSPSGQDDGHENRLLDELAGTLKRAGKLQLTPHYPSNHETVKQVLEYLAGHRSGFDLDLKLYGTVFQQKVWQALLTIPYGLTQCYADIAAAVDNPRGARAVGMANNRNPISLIIPCHRVIGKNGSLVGYGGGLDMKINLLTLEKAAHRQS